MIKFKIDVMDELKKRGYSANRLRNEKLLSESTMQAIRISYNTGAHLSINTKAIDTICRILDKQPAYFLEYVRDH